MDTLSAFAMGELARSRGDSMTYFDGVKIKKLMKEHQVSKAYIYLASDRDYTETEVKIKKGKLQAHSIGVYGSIWATPMLDIDGEEIEVGTKIKKRMTIKFV